MEWLNEPPEWDATDDGLNLTTGDQGDFWRATHYGFIRDTGHFAGHRQDGDFTATVRFDADYEAQYDQAGLMVRVNEENWLKTGIEYFDGHRHFSAVVTREFSDWSVVRWSHDGPVWVRIVRKGTTYAIHASPDGDDWTMVRLLYLPSEGAVMVGPTACSPSRAGLSVRFTRLTLSDPIEFSA